MTEQQKYYWFYGIETLPLKEQIEIYNAYLDSENKKYER